MKTAILMCHYGSNLKMTEDCIKSLQDKDGNFDEIIISNNNEGTLEREEIKASGKITIINNGRNLGYPGGINQGLKYALKQKLDNVFIINNDCIVQKPFLKDLLSFALEKEEIGMAFTPLKYKKNNDYVYDLGGFQNWFGKLFHKEVNNLSGNNPQEISFAGCFLLKMDVARKIGLMDENFFLYYDDIDYCIEARKKGYKIFSYPKSFIYHGLSKTVGVGTPKASYHQTRSAILYMKKHLFPSPIFLIFIMDLLFNSFKRIYGNYALTPFIIRAYLDGFTGRVDPKMTA